MKIKHIVFLIHPCGYEELHRNKPEEIRKNNYELYLEREQEVKQRWLATLSLLDKATLFVQHDRPQHIFEAAKEQLGESNVCHVERCAPNHGEWPHNEWREYHRRQVGQILHHVEKFNLELDPATVTSEIWGASFEGCAAHYAGAFAQGLRLKRPPKMHFEMTVYDSRFLYGARRWEAIPLSGSDIEAWLFELHDGTGAAIFQARLTPQWLDQRPILLHLNPQRIQVCTPQGHTVWPPAPGSKWCPDTIWPYCITVGGGSFSGPSLDNVFWVRSVRMPFDDFRTVIAAATLAN